MSELRVRQQQLLAYLTEGESSISAYVVGDDQLSATQRLSIYQNAYRSRFREVIDTDHPVLGTYLGDDLYDQLVSDYIRLYPSHHRSLRQYCEQLPGFLRDKSPFKDYPQIAELAQFEKMLIVVFDAEDKSVIGPADLQAINPELWPELRFRFHPSLQLFLCQHNVVEIWQAIKAELTPPKLIPQNYAWVLWRNAERLTEFISVSRIELLMLQRFMQGQTLAEVADVMVHESGEENAPEYLLETLMRWLSLGWVYRLDHPENGPALEIVDIGKTEF